jgi:hypothetical protein
MKLRILPSAFDDLARGRIFYEQQGGKALGEYYFSTLFSDIDSLTLYAGIHGKIDDYFRLLSKRFPYAIYYKVNDDLLVVWLVVDCRENPCANRNKLR